tara:strand:+ start:37286 stop:38323 length:1038 start_codon:yes stop_codon:yes gene_type:complete
MNRRGFTLIEFVVYVGGLALVTLLISALLMATQKHFLETRLTLNVEELHAHILLALTNPNGCYNTFTGINRAALFTNIASIRNSFNTVLYATAGGPYYQNISITRMRATNFLQNPAAGAPLPYTGSFDLNIRYRVPIGTGGTTRNMDRVITIRTTVPTAVGQRLVPDYNALDQNTYHRCTAGTSAGFGYDPNAYVQRDRYDSTAKQGSLTIEGNMNVVAWAGGGGNPAQSGSIRSYGGVYTLSDRRFKSDIKPLLVNFDEVFSLIEGKEFSWKQDGRRDYGFIAQDVEKVLPQLVSARKTDGKKTVNYSGFVPILHESYKNMSKENRKLEKRLDKIETKLRIKSN